MSNSTRRGRPFVIKPDQVRLYYEAMYAVVTQSEWPWTGLGPIPFREPPTRNDELPTPAQLQHQLETYLNLDAQKTVKARVRKARYRMSRRQMTVHLDADAWALLADYANQNSLTFSEAVRTKFTSKDQS